MLVRELSQAEAQRILNVLGHGVPTAEAIRSIIRVLRRFEPVSYSPQWVRQLAHLRGWLEDWLLNRIVADRSNYKTALYDTKAYWCRQARYQRRQALRYARKLFAAHVFIN
jgi:hypothetical protein